MAVRAFTDRSESLLSAIKRGIAAGEVLTGRSMRTVTLLYLMKNY